eukprot:2863730-Pyramimonas_sp.AAC.1
MECARESTTEPRKDRRRVGLPSRSKLNWGVESLLACLSGLAGAALTAGADGSGCERALFAT